MCAVRQSHILFWLLFRTSGGDLDLESASTLPDDDMATTGRIFFSAGRTGRGLNGSTFHRVKRAKQKAGEFIDHAISLHSTDRLFPYAFVVNSQ